MGELLSHFKGYDIQATRREEREKTIKEMTEQITKEVTEKVKQEEVLRFINAIKSLNVPKELVFAQLLEQYDCSEHEAEKLLEAYW